MQDLINKIKQLKKERNAVILAHNYQREEIQQIADYVGDSLALSKLAVDVKEDTICFCGVRFMAETAKILSPNKTVLLPVLNAGCPMADMINEQELIEMKKKYPKATVVCYVNSTAEVKAESDVCCTSSNAVEVVGKIDNNKIIFVPDKNLGSYVQKHLPEKEIICWNGYCTIHHSISLEEIMKIKQQRPNTKIAIHPECKQEVIELADYIGSTAQIINYISNSKEKEFIIGTEMGILTALQERNPDKKFYMLSPKFICSNMKKTTLESVKQALKENKHEIILNEELIQKAKKSLNRMLT